MTNEKEELYSQSFDFDLEIFDLEYDSGVGEKRRILAERPDEKYLLFIDSDMKIPENYELLVEQLERRPDIGFLAGMYLEKDRLYTVASDLFIDDGTLYRDIREKKAMTSVAGAPIAEFDFLPQVGLLRKECAEDYNWDGEYTIMREHIDFFVGHWKETNWTMAQSTTVFFPHYPGGDEEYELNRNSNTKFKNSDEYFLNKWSIDDFKQENARWIDTFQPSKNKIDRLNEIYHKNGRTAAAEATFSYFRRLIENVLTQ